ncbi:reverse transcriptase domain-containing protein [Tanacetum coccineum]|uniref:Reverse transcriptase domain-containing protein n=1 Tax=Tanacetum coccineum TaxID=301880 RepID=A0ABQ5EF65_9ASTR
MEELLQAPTKRYGEAIVIPEINVDHFEIKTNLLQLVQANPFHGFERENPHTHINNFKRITSTLKFRDVPNGVIKLMMFPYSLEAAARVWYDKEPPNSILTWDDLVNKFVNQFFPPSKTTHLKNEISRFTQKFEETFGEAWERFKEMLRAYSLNAAAGGNLLSKTTREALNIIENKSKVRYSRNKPNVSRVNSTSRESSSKTDERIDKLADQISTLVEIVTKKVVTPATVKAVEESCVICGDDHAYYNCPTTNSNQSSVCAATGFQNQPFQAPNNQVQQGISNEFSSYMKSNDQMMRNMQNQINSLKGEFKHEIQNTMKTQQTVLMNQQNAFQNNLQNMLSGFFQNQASTSGTLPSNTIPNPKGEMKAITTRSGVAYEGPSIPTNPSPKKVVERETEETTDKEQTNFQGSTAHIQPPVNPIPIPEPDVPKTLPKPNIPYPSRLNDQKLREKATNQMEKFFQIFQDLHFDISFADALLLMPKFASTIKSLLTNKDKLFELAKIPLNENCSAMLLKKLPKKLGDPDKFLIPCYFPGMNVCHALANLGASINLMPLSIWNKLSLPELTLTRMTLKLADRSITRPKGVAEDVFVKVGKFHFPTDFVVVDFDADPRVPLILGRSFLRTGRALIDVYGEEITLRVNDEAVTFNLNQTMRYSSTYDDMSVNRIDVIDVACEEYAQEVLGFSNKSMGGNPIPTFEPIISDSSPSLTPFEGSDFILEEIEAYLKDDSISPEIDHADFDPEGDICLIEILLNDDPFQLPLMGLKQAEVTKAKSSIEEPPELELKDLPSHLEYAYLEGIDKLPVIVAKGLKDDEKEALLKVLKSHKQAIAWKITDIKGIDPRFSNHKILMEKDYKPTVQSQRWVNPKIHEVIKKEVIKLLDAGMIYPISDSPKLNEATRKDHFPLPFMDQMLERLAGNEFYCFLDGFSRCMMAIFHDMIEKTIEVFMDDFSVFGDSFATCLSNLDNMLKRCEETNLVLNWEKCHFKCKEGIVLGHKISKSGIEERITKKKTKNKAKTTKPDSEWKRLELIGSILGGSEKSGPGTLTGRGYGCAGSVTRQWLDCTLEWASMWGFIESAQTCLLSSCFASLACLLHHPRHLHLCIPDSEPGRVLLGADEEISMEMYHESSYYGYDGLPMQLVAPPSPDYVPGPEHPPSPIEIPYVPEPEYPEYLDGDDEPSDDDTDDDDTDDDDEEPFEDEEDDEEEEEHLALADSPVIPVADPVPLAGDTETFETDETPLGYRAAGIRMRAAVASPPSLLPPTSPRTDVPEAEMPPRKRACLTTPAPGYDSGEIHGWSRETAKAYSIG